MKIVVLVGLILFILLFFKVFSARKNIKASTKNQNETTIDLEKDPKTQEYKPKE